MTTDTVKQDLFSETFDLRSYLLKRGNYTMFFRPLFFVPEGLQRRLSLPEYHLFLALYDNEVGNTAPSELTFTTLQQRTPITDNRTIKKALERLQKRRFISLEKTGKKTFLVTVYWIDVFQFLGKAWMQKYLKGDVNKFLPTDIERKKSARDATFENEKSARDADFLHYKEDQIRKKTDKKRTDHIRQDFSKIQQLTFDDLIDRLQLDPRVQEHRRKNDTPVKHQIESIMIERHVDTFEARRALIDVLTNPAIHNPIGFLRSPDTFQHGKYTNPSFEPEFITQQPQTAISKTQEHQQRETPKIRASQRGVNKTDRRKHQLHQQIQPFLKESSQHTKNTRRSRNQDPQSLSQVLEEVFDRETVKNAFKGGV